MMKKYPQDKATALHGRAVAATLLIGGAVGGLALPAFAQQPGQAADGGPPAKVQVFETSPSLRQATLSAVAQSAKPEPVKPAESEQASTASRAPAVSISWILGSSTRPWALSAPELPLLNTLGLSLPSEREARTMLPGAVSDLTDQSRFIITRYVTDNIGVALQGRGRQLETLNQWLAGLQTQKQALPKDPWAAYQFSNEAWEKVSAFKAKISTQTEPTVQRMANDITRAVAQVTPVMNVMGSYEQKMQWYNILVQLKAGLGAYQARALEGDRQILDAIEAFERDNPRVALPAGPVPVEQSHNAPAPSVTAPVAVATEQVKREAAQVPATPEAQGGLSGNVVLLAVGGLVGGFFFFLRKRVAGKGRTAKKAAE
jgi:hypothetical protein